MAILDDSLSSVTSAGADLTFSIPDRLRGVRISRVLVVHSAGSATSFDVEVSTDATFADSTRRVALFEAEASVADYDNAGLGYVWAYTDGAGAVYVRVTPDAGADNAFSVRLIVMEA